MNALRVRAVGVAARRLPSAAPTATAVRAFVPTGPCSKGPLDDRESALENMYFNKQDEQLMRQLLAKMKQTADHHDEDGAAGAAASERSALLSIVEKYKVSNEDIDGAFDLPKRELQECANALDRFAFLQL